MASLAQDRAAGRAGQGKAAKAPLSTHPAFPFIVGLWFAALLGIGSMMVPVPVIERLVELTGLASLVPQTAPPLGFTARALIALGCTVGGGLAGLLIARKVGQAHRAQTSPRQDRNQVAARRPISAHDELGADGLDGPGSSEAPRGRRALAVADEEKPSELFDVPPPAGKALPLSALDLAEVEALELADAEMLESDPAAADLDACEAPTPGFTTLANDPADDAATDLAEEDFSMAERQHFKLDTFGQTVSAPIQPQQRFVLDPAPPVQAPPATVELPEEEADLHFSPPSLARPFVQPDHAPDPTEDAAMDPFAQTPAFERPMLEPVETDPQAAAPASEGPQGELDDLALVQLAQRLGASIARRREQRAAEAAQAAAAQALASSAPVALQAAMPAALAEDFDAAEAAEAAQAMAAYFGAAEPAVESVAEAVAEPEPAPAPAATVTPLAAPGRAAMVPPAARQVFRPVAPEPVAPQPAPLANLAQIDLGEDDEEEDEHIAQLAASFSLPLAAKAPAAVIPSAYEPEPAAGEEDEDEETIQVAPAPAPFANPFQHKAQPFVRIENEPQPEDGAIEPAVVFPGEVRADVDTGAQRASAEENERALREALLGLQRMNSVA